MFKYFSLITFLYISISQAAIQVNGTQFIDDQGRTVFFRGINMAIDGKLPPFRALTKPENLDPLPSWGINQIRLLFIWEAFEPERGKYDYSYLNYYTNIIKWAKERNLSVIVDFHQDGYSRFVSRGCGEGFPKWTLPQGMEPDLPRNNEDCKNWSLITATSPKMHRAWKHFYKNTYGVRTRYLMMVKEVVTATKGFSNVIGYDLLNEPWGSSKRKLSPFYEDVANVIRAHHKDAVLFITPHILTVVGVVGINLKKPTFDNFAVSAHFYDSAVLMLEKWLGFNPRFKLNRYLRKTRKWNVPLFIGEYGMALHVKRGKKFITKVRNFFNKNLMSHAQWGIAVNWNEDDKDGWNSEDLSIVDENYQLRENFVVYATPHRVSGKVSKVDNSETSTKNSLTLTWDHNKELGETEIFVPKSYLSDRGRIQKTEDLSCHYKQSRFRMYCSSSINGLKTVKIFY